MRRIAAVTASLLVSLSLAACAVDGASQSADETACHNGGRFSEMGKLPDTARHVAYDCQPTGGPATPQAISCGYRTSKWTSLKEYSDVSGIGATALSALKSVAAPWKANGLSHDTV